MKQCPNCQFVYDDESLRFCLQDGANLVNISEKDSETPTVYLGETETVVRQNKITNGWEKSKATQELTPETQTKKSKLPLVIISIALAMCILFGGIIGVWMLLKTDNSSDKDLIKIDNRIKVPPTSSPLTTPKITNGIDLSGVWVNEKDGIESELRQSGNQINFEYRGSVESGHGALTGKFSGIFDGKTLRGTVENHEGSVTGHGTGTFTLNGNRLEGRAESEDGKQWGEWILIRKSAIKNQDKNSDNASLDGEKFKACNYFLGAEIYKKWIEKGGETGKLGCPIMNETEAFVSPQGTTGRMTQFAKGDGGYLIRHENGQFSGTTFEVSGCMFKLYNSLGGTKSWLGFPVEDEYSTSPGARQDFEGGYILWDSKTYKCEVHGKELRKGV